MNTLIVLALSSILFMPSGAFAQDGPVEKLSLQQAIDLALKNNNGVKAAAFGIDYQKELKKAALRLNVPM